MSVLNFYDAQDAMKNVELNAILNAAHNGILAVDKEGLISIYNPAAERVVGISYYDAICKPVSQIIPETGMLKILKTGKKSFGQKLHINGKIVVTNITPVFNNGEIVGAVAFFQDISELESITVELQSYKRLNKELEALIDSSYDGIYVTDGHGYTLRVNSAYERITGVHRSEVIGKHMGELEKLGLYSQSVTLLVLKQKKTITIMQRIRHKKDVLVTGNPIFAENGEIAFVVTNVRDITELNKLRDELAKTKQLSQRYYNELSELRMQHKPEDIIAHSPAMNQILRLVFRVAKVDTTTLITGESGVGKEPIARLIHEKSNRKHGPFITINCGAIPDNLLESELFGYEPGAFSGAKKEGKPGLFEVAETGTLLLDEIADLPLHLQVKLLRVLQEKEVLHVGGVKPIKINVRIIASTNRNLIEMVDNGHFREDLYYRLNIVPIYIPPLRERTEEIIPLAYHFLKKYNQKYAMNKSLNPETIKYLLCYHWPGNVRELENTIERLVVVTESNTIMPTSLPTAIRKKITAPNPQISINTIMPFKQAVAELETKLIDLAYKKYQNINEVAKALGVHRTTIIRKRNKLKSK
jgi:PAS domain S-box-containing protein